MTATAEIRDAIAEITGTALSTVHCSLSTVWIYGQVVWAELPAFRFIACRGVRPSGEVKLMASQVRRFRDGDSSFFLIEMPQTMADALGLQDYILDDDELERMKRNIDTSRAW